MRLLWKVLLVLLAVLLIAGYFRFYWRFATGVKSGELNFVVHKGILFKTYEGKMIQTGVRSQNGTLQSFEFPFSVEDDALARRLMLNSGSQFTLHYSEYLGAVPWRGYSKFVVDSIVAMEPVHR